MSIGSRIKERREQLNMTRADLAARIGVTPSAIANYENGISNPKIDYMIRIFDALDCDANYIHQDDMKGIKYHIVDITEESDSLIRQYERLDAYGKQLVDLVLQKELERCQKEKEGE
jgi:transcriptional regulator with XRE-family HTH domain